MSSNGTIGDLGPILTTAGAQMYVDHLPEACANDLTQGHQSRTEGEFAVVVAQVQVESDLHFPVREDCLLLCVHLRLSSDIQR